ncbi:MAG: hypothetical protein M3680_32490 [Myxococcota bacterium]|nr:hypothetical protein [Myxococcota bacterium]
MFHLVDAVVVGRPASREAKLATLAHEVHDEGGAAVVVDDAARLHLIGRDDPGAERPERRRDQPRDGHGDLRRGRAKPGCRWSFVEVCV